MILKKIINSWQLFNLLLNYLILNVVLKMLRNNWSVEKSYATNLKNDLIFNNYFYIVTIMTDKK